MPFEIRHGDDTNLEAIVALLAALPQGQPNGQPPMQQQPLPRQQQRPRDALDDIMDQLAPLAAPGANGSTALRQPQAVNGNGAPSYRQVPTEQRPRYSVGGAAPRALRANNGSVNGYDRMADQDARAMYAAQQQQQLQDDREQQAYAQVEMNQGDQMARWAQDIPPAIQQGLMDGTYQHSPIQQRDMQADLDAIAAVDGRPDWTPAQKERFRAQRWMHYKGIYSTPQLVPQNKRPVTPQQQFQQSVVEFVDPDTGKKIRGTWETPRGGGSPQFKPFKPAADPHEIEAIRQENRVAIEAIRAENAAKTAASKPKPATPAQRAQRSVRQAAITADIHALQVRIEAARARAIQAEDDLHALPKGSDPNKAPTAADTADVKRLFQQKADAELEAQKLEHEKEKYIQDAQAAEEEAYRQEEQEAAAPPGDQFGDPQMMADEYAQMMGETGQPPMAGPPMAPPVVAAPVSDGPPMSPPTQGQRPVLQQNQYLTDDGRVLEMTEQGWVTFDSLEEAQRYYAKNAGDGWDATGANFWIGNTGYGDGILYQIGANGDAQPVPRDRYVRLNDSPPSQQSSPVPVSSQAELAALPIGTKFILPDGRTGTRQ